MVKMHVPLLLTIVYILQVYSSSEDQSELSIRLADQSELSEAPEHKFNCASLCEQVDTGYAGICCGNNVNFYKIYFKNYVIKYISGIVL